MIYDDYINLNTVGGSSNAYSLRLTITLNSQDKINNKSNITINSYMKTNASYWGWSGFYSPKLEIKLTPNTTDVETSLVNITVDSLPTNNTGNWVLKGSWTGDIEHNSDGKLKLSSVKAIFNPNTSSYSYLPESGTLLASDIEITKIPRMSDLDVGNGQYIDNNENGLNIKVTKNISTYYDVLEVVYNGTTYATRTGVDGTFNLILTEEELNNIYIASSNDKLPSLEYKLTTYNDNNMTEIIGYTIKNGYLILSNAMPIFNTFTYQDTNIITSSLTNDNQRIIKNYSDVKVIISNENKAIGVKGASIVSYRFQDGIVVSYSDTLEVNYTLNKYNFSNSIIVTAIDSRGNETSAKIDGIPLIIYDQIPLITNVLTERKNGVESETYLSLNAKLWVGDYNISRPNTITYFGYRVKSVKETWGDQTWYDKTAQFLTAIAGQELNNISISINDKFKIYENGTSGGFTEGSEFDIQIRISDGYNTTIFNSDFEDGYIQNGILLDTYYKSDTGYKYAINGMVNTELDDGLQVYGKLYLNETEIIESGTTTHGGYTKYSNGLMIEYGKVSISTKIDSQWGSVYEASVVLPNFPIEFKYLYSCNISTYGRACFIEYFNTTISNIGTGYISRPVADTQNYTYTFNYIAIGTWK